jgi:hypothetical protein
VATGRHIGVRGERLYKLSLLGDNASMAPTMRGKSEIDVFDLLCGDVVAFEQ